MSICKGWGKFYSGLANGAINVYNWKCEETEIVKTENPVTRLAAADQGRLHVLVILSSEGRISIRDAETGLLIRSCRIQIRHPSWMTLCNDLVYLSTADKELIILDIMSGRVEKQLHFTNHSTGLAVYDDYVFTISYNGVINCFNKDKRPEVSDDDETFDPKELAPEPRDYIPLWYKEKAVALAEAHPKWSLKSLQKGGLSRLKHRKYLSTWKEDIRRGGTRFDKRQSIDNETRKRSIEPRKNVDQVCDKKLFYGAGKNCLTCIHVYNDWVFTGNRKGEISFFHFDPFAEVTCKFHSCNLAYGFKEDLAYHIEKDHLSKKKSSNVCQWHRCRFTFPDTSDSTDKMNHLKSHIYAMHL